MTLKKFQILYSLLDELEREQPNWLSVSTAKSLVKASIRLIKGKKK